MAIDHHGKLLNTESRNLEKSIGDFLRVLISAKATKDVVNGSCNSSNDSKGGVYKEIYSDISEYRALSTKFSNNFYVRNGSGILELDAITALYDAIDISGLNQDYTKSYLKNHAQELPDDALDLKQQYFMLLLRKMNNYILDNPIKPGIEVKKGTGLEKKQELVVKFTDLKESLLSIMQKKNIVDDKDVSKINAVLEKTKTPSIAR